MDLGPARLFRSYYSGRRFYCGVWLGGCGAELNTKIGEGIKVAHFAHKPGARVCRRVNIDEQSADHLRISRELAQWARNQGRTPGKATFDGTVPGEGGTCHGLRLPVGDGGLVAVSLRREQVTNHAETWRKRDNAFTAQSPRVDWLFSPDLPVVRDVMRERGYALVVRCERQGGDTTVQVGTRFPGGLTR